jgi:DNA-directed RNA polymerase specialized sigma24 family protein
VADIVAATFLVALEKSDAYDPARGEPEAWLLGIAAHLLANQRRRLAREHLAKARRAVLPPRRATQEQYRQYVRELGSDTAGRLELGPEDRPITERARLNAAAQAEGVNLKIQRRGNTIVFWKTNEPPQARAGRGRRGGQGR